MRKTFVIIVILAGCGDVSTAAAPSQPREPAEPMEPEPNEPAPDEPEPREPQALETPCDEVIVADGGIYFYAQAQAPDWAFEAFACYESGKPFEAPTCDPATEYAIEDGVVSVLCGEWQPGADLGSYRADFVRLEETALGCGDPRDGGFGGSGGTGGPECNDP